MFDNQNRNHNVGSSFLVNTADYTYRRVYIEDYVANDLNKTSHNMSDVDYGSDQNYYDEYLSHDDFLDVTDDYDIIDDDF